MDSAGLWLFVFAVFALVTLSLGESKIQKRMQIYHYRITGVGNKEIAQNQTKAAPAERLAEPRQVNEEPDYIYSLSGLRWIFGASAVAGLVIFGWPYLRGNQASADSP